MAHQEQLSWGQPWTEPSSGDEQSQAANTDTRNKHFGEQRSWERDGTLTWAGNYCSKPP